MDRILRKQEVEPERGLDRLYLGIPARFISLHGELKVTLVDLSMGGAQIALREPLRAREGMLYWLRNEEFVEVAWRDSRHLGLKFEEPLAPRVVAETRRTVAAFLAEQDAHTQAEAQRWASGG